MNTIKTAEEIDKSRNESSPIMRILTSGYEPFLTHKKLEDTIKMIDNKERGYEPRCKTCNSKYLDKIEEMRDHEFSFDEIHDYLLKQGEDISSMALSRHFSYHDPQKKEYEKYLKIKEERAKQIDKEKIENAIKMYGPLKYVFEDYKSRFIFNGYERDMRDFDAKKHFLECEGYCTTTNRFCEQIPAGEVSSWFGVVEDLDNALYRLVRKDPRNRTHENRIRLMEQKLKCYNCHELYDKDLQEYLIHLLIDKVFKFPIGEDEFKYLFAEECDYDYQEMDKLLIELKKLKKKSHIS